MLKKFGITLEKVEGNSVDKFIEKMQKLQLIDVDVSKIVQRDTILTLAMKSGKTEDDVKKIGLDPKERIGAAKNSITQAYRGRGTNARATEDQANILLKMGISLEGKKRTSKEIAEASISSLKDIEMADEEDKALREEVEKTKEGGILISE